MRTLKKSLALVLALVMLLGLGVVGASADNALDNYTDADEIGDAYLEAVGVLTGLGIVDGMTETTIVPQATYTRAQAAKIITTMVLGVNGAKSCVASYAPFQDVAAEHWAAGYIAFCKEQGIIDGVTDTTFDPEGTLTGYQWAKMLLAAVGFNANNELEGSSWSLNTARIGREVGLFDGDLAGADHTPLRREQAMLYAFNTLSGIKQVTYSANATNYVYGIKGYVFADGTGYTLGQKVFDLAKVEGQIIDNEGMGASKTYVDNVNDSKWTSKDDVIAVSADTGLDLMYHAVRVWYVAGKTNTGVYTYDLAKVETTTCPTAKQIPTTYKTIGEKGEKYQLDKVDNSALDLGTTNVVFVVDYGTMGYTDAAKKTTAVSSNTVKTNTTVATVDVMTDISDIDYKASILYLYTKSLKETATATDNKEALYIVPVTSTVGTVKSYSQDTNGKWTVTLDDDTKLSESVFWDRNANNESFTIGQTYTFVLDTHGDVIYATRDGARSLYVYTGEWRATGNYNDINTDRGRELRFLNATTGEEYWASVYFTDGAAFSGARRGTYVDISAGTNNLGLHRAQIITSGDNTYAAGYVIDNWTAVVTGNDQFFAPDMSGKDIYYDADTITFLVATGLGSNMTIKSYTGVASFKEALGIPDNGAIGLENAALTVTATKTGDWNASVVFVLAENVDAFSNYVFLPSDIDLGNWSEVSGDNWSYLVAYNGAYINGELTTIYLDLNELRSEFGTYGKINRGFYTLLISYDVNGAARYVLDERVDNEWGSLCFYQNVNMTNTGNTVDTWRLNGYRIADDVKVVDTTNPSHNALDVDDAWAWVEYHGEEIAFTVNPVTRKVDVIYLVNDGWDAKVTVELSDALQDAGWVITNIDGKTFDAEDEVVAYTFNDDAAEELVKDSSIHVRIYNAKLAKYSNTSYYALTVVTNGDEANAVTYNHSLQDGTFYMDDIKVPSMAEGNKTYTYEIGGLVLEDVELKLSNTNHKFKGLDANENDVVGDIVLGTSVDFDFSQVTGNFGQKVDEVYWTGKYMTEYTVNGDLYEVTTGQKTTQYVSVDDFYPLTGGENAIASDKWVPTTNA